MCDVGLLGYRLKAARALRGLTLRELAELVCCSAATLGRYESGLVGSPSMPLLIVCADTLRVSVPWLFGAESVAASDDDEECAWLERAISRLMLMPVTKYKRLCV